MDPLTLAAAINAAIALISLINKERENFHQDKEKTEAQRAELDAKIASIPTLSHWNVKD